MSGEGRAAEANVSAAGVRVAIVAASWHETVMDGLLAGARSYLTEIGAQVHEVRVPEAAAVPTIRERKP